MMPSAEAVIRSALVTKTKKQKKSLRMRKMEKGIRVSRIWEKT